MSRIRRTLVSSLPVAGTLDTLRILNRLLAVAVVLALVVLLFAPWQQSVAGQGRVIAYAPVDRQQNIEAPIDGRVTKWHVQEGDSVRAGDPIAELSDNDPEILDRLGRQRDAVAAQVEAANLTIAVSESRVEALRSVRDAAIENARLRNEMAVQRERAAARAVDAAEASLHTAQLQVRRQRSLHDKGLVSTRDLELAELQETTSTAEVDRARATLRAASREVAAFEATRNETAADALGDIESARSSIQSAIATKAKAEGELAELDVRLARQQSMRIVAPRDGVVMRVMARAGGEMVKSGDPLAVLVPRTDSRAVELLLDGNDAPLVTPGRTVRLQFEGWPAIQFVGWPSVAVGTFPGVVAFVDPADDGSGKFRVVVVPEQLEDWPEARYLRQGVRTNGWVLLNEVGLGYELWRQFNGFPPTLPNPAGESGKAG